MRRSSVLVTVLFFLGFAVAAYASPIIVPNGIYTVNAGAPGGTITGQLTFNGSTVTPTNFVFNDGAAGNPIFTGNATIGQNNGYADVFLNTISGNGGQMLLYFSSVTSGNVNLLICQSNCNPFDALYSYIHLYNNYNDYQPANLTSGTLLASSATPEPSSLLLLGTGLCSIVGFARRRLNRT
jgi:hypothetical protein